MNTPEVFVVSAARTAIGTFGGSLKDVPPADLATTAVKAALQRSGVDPAQVGHLVMGNVIPTETRDAYISRVAAMNAGIPKETPAYNVNRLCGSGLQAIISAAQTLLLGDAEIAIGAGAESMSRGPYLLPSARWGARMGNVQAVDYMLGILHDPFHGIHMGITAENVAARNGITREMQDALALEDQKRAAFAIANGYFNEQIATVEIHGRKETVLFNVDEHPRATTLEQLAQMKPAFKKDGSVTAGNASGLNDGAAALVMATGDAVQRNSLRPLARLVTYAHAGVEPELMGLGPIPATRLALKRAGLSVQDMDVVEANIAFAAQACAVSQELGLDPAKVNPNGSGIALGHPVGATGAIIATKAIHELHRINGRYALVTM
ncbi:acetyl-CoA C-acyltransferase family protein [Pseudomonas gregormendelii]|uniref:Acetyl-CoA C-acyltransferase family protein n=1 Tax=Pseudomonas gregormendelii TaxID=1628277 RepID=A0ABS3AED0_9PSED|nr:acetyl-CoA C-acyltransferase family protein [Pseudomonas gregormendelii]MBN3965510.1 acetyl-CoA C-acyltransferase family protein [Pseudomonas gregormendelii]